ncbi:efflux transporter periplasmic adaptor subunit [Hahella sp. CCB-MM4]|uniref:efflux RND transporter periplasmic adaptor subunit n=1 Tax=Hahella sp. (strain CCB-MM4) TaxID=1926491 RepID=UPI000B9B1DAD|nr:efflux RND transporter periplasmic adaptor subunit [Hahella sp. CCB-MM4]OZG69769.1 efflux transporter periplasmic adaptor subunit [Hahella sp. CCB-MM4]
MKALGILILVAAAFGGGVMVQGYLAGQGMSLAGSSMSASDSSAEGGSTEPLYWVAPMDPNYRRDKPGKSPMGMDLVPVYEEDGQGGDEGTVKISPVVVNNLGVRTAEVQKGSLSLPIQTVGYVAFDEGKLVHIHGRVDGWIEVLNVTSEGDPVSRGQTLYELYSPTLVNAQEEYLAAVRSKNNLLKQASRSRLESLGLSSAQINALEKRGRVEQRIKVVAETDGVVSKLNVRQGMFVKPATEIMSIGELDSVWVIAEVFERQSNWVKPGQRVVMEASAIPGKNWEGVVDYLYPVLDSKTRTLRVRVRFDNPEQSLKPNMFADLTIYAEVAEQAISIPREALIRGARYDRVVVENGDGSFKSVLVSPGQEADGRVEILEGLSAGDQVVTSAQFLIDSESNIDADIARMEAREAGDDNAATEGNSVIATGKVESVMADMAMITVTHDPIEAWSWPTMKMDFDVAQGVSLDGLKAGQSIEFELSKQGDWEYLITAIKGQEVSQAAMSNNEMTQVAMNSMTADPLTGGVMATGEIKGLMPDMDMIEVRHDPIPEWQWPAMTMSFMVKDSSVLNQLKAGDKIRFKLRETEDGDYVLSDPESRQ